MYLHQIYEAGTYKCGLDFRVELSLSPFSATFRKYGVVLAYSMHLMLRRGKLPVRCSHNSSALFYTTKLYGNRVKFLRIV